jgi:DNA polymerase
METKEEFQELLRRVRERVIFAKELGVEDLPMASMPAAPQASANPPASLFEGQSEPQSGPAPSLEAVREELGECTRCKLHPTRKTIVFGTGNPKAGLVFVGEAPGEEEDLQGKPFVGRAGQLLTKIIGAMGLSREEVYIANIIKCRPPQNRNPQPDEIGACEPFLIKQLRAIRPKVICALGTFAAQTLLGTAQKISQLRGRFHDYNGIKLLPTFHPAYLLRNPHEKKVVWEDMQKIMEELRR